MIFSSESVLLVNWLLIMPLPAEEWMRVEGVDMIILELVIISEADEAGRLDRIMSEPGAVSMYSPPKPFSPPLDCCSRLDLGSSNSSLLASLPPFCNWNSPWRSAGLRSWPGLYSRKLEVRPSWWPSSEPGWRVFSDPFWRWDAWNSFGI